MKFGDRMSFTSEVVWHRRWRHYLSSLERAGFSSSDPLVRYFAGEVFHDGRFWLRRVDLTNRAAVIELENVYAIDALNSLLGKKGVGARPVLDRRDFRTTITFAGLTGVTLMLEEGGGILYYHSAELARRGRTTVLTIFLRHNAEARSRIRFEFESARIEEIHDKLRKYLSRPMRLSRLLAPSALPGQN